MVLPAHTSLHFHSIRYRVLFVSFYLDNQLLHYAACVLISKHIHAIMVSIEYDYEFYIIFSDTKINNNTLRVFAIYAIFLQLVADCFPA